MSTLSGTFALGLSTETLAAKLDRLESGLKRSSSKIKLNDKRSDGAVDCRMVGRRSADGSVPPPS